MRSWFVSLAALAAALPTLTAQAPPAPAEPPPVVIRPRLPGQPVPKAGDPAPPRVVTKDGMIVFTPRAPGAATPPPPPAEAPVPAVGLPAPAAPAAGKVVFDYWFVAAVDGKRIGHLHWSAREVNKDGRVVVEGVKYQKLTVKRFGQVVSQWGEESTAETPDGEVLAVALKQGLGKDQALAIAGVVDGKVLKITGDGAAKAARDTPWPGGVTGVAREPFLVRDHKPKPGESFDSLTYVASLNRVIKVTTTAEAEEDVTLYPGTKPRRLLRVVSRMEPVGNFRLPASTEWVDAATFEPKWVEFDFPGLGGTVTFLRTTEKAATAPIDPRDVPDVFNVQSIVLDREVPNIHSRPAVTYKVTMPKDDDPATAVATDPVRQVAKNLDAKAKSFELVVTAVHTPTRPAAPVAAPPAEFTASNYFVNSDDPTVRTHAQKAVSGLPAGAGAWDKARAVERWVKANMKGVEFEQAMATADNVARTLTGDCTEFAMLSAAMCRAAGVPSRTALGLVYVPPAPGGKPVLAYHMWFEVLVDGQWLALDATLGLGGVGPGHVKITDHSWHDEKSFAPLLPVLRVLMAKPTFDVVR